MEAEKDNENTAIVGWKKLGGKLVQLRIPKEARRVQSFRNSMWRAEFAIVEGVEGGGPVYGHYKNQRIKYAPGLKVVPDKYDDNPNFVRTHGIHFVLTKEEAEKLDF